MELNEITEKIIDAAVTVHRRLGPGLLESVYLLAMVRELVRRGLSVAREVPVRIMYDGEDLGEGFRADLVVNDLVVVELKSVEQVHAVHKKQLLTYLRLMNKRVGLLLNFGAALMKDGIHRVANGIED
ncbi:MAG: GxxExxY protein [Planctomycetes bacterium]|jgi:GxxExxY protein|nr:GxxExxY protein [Planctomycetota bacterium]